MTRDKSGLMTEFSFYIKNRVPHESIIIWLETLSDDERQIILNEITAIIERAMLVWDHLVPIVERVVDSFMNGISPEIKATLESISAASLANM